MKKLPKNFNWRENNGIYFCEGLRLGFVMYFLPNISNQKVIADCFLEMWNVHRSVKLDHITMFLSFEAGLRSKAIDWSDIDKLLSSLEDEKEIKQFMKNGFDKLFQRVYETDEWPEYYTGYKKGKKK